MYSRKSIAVVGRSCRLPGASSVSELWRLLEQGTCAVSSIPADRWSLDKHFHPRKKTPGRSYTWAAGVLADIWGFDAGAFDISPRAALQLDPQQRLLLELSFEACEDAGFAPSKLAGSNTGVYVGVSALDYSTVGLHDLSVADVYFATGNTMSIVANRLSHAFDLHGPSLAIDTACSSSLVSLHEARHALIRGEIDCALVGGVNILASPFGFIVFAQATMLSPTGLCRPFSAEADGYVRAEGGVVLVLKTLEKALSDGDRIHGVICDSAVNSDGRTSGIFLPSEEYQSKLLQTIYGPQGIAPEAVAYIETHGTGTAAGDPIEAAALGRVLGQTRTRPLPVGSIKSNLGHTEPASGVVGLLKAMLALEHDVAPRSINCEVLNPSIDFDALNLVVAREATPLARTEQARFAGVSSFGFGGTSAHVVLTDPPRRPKSAYVGAPRVVMLSAQSEDALRSLAGEYAHRLASVDSGEAMRIVAATNHRREPMSERFVSPVDDVSDLVAGLGKFAATGECDARSVRAAVAEGSSDIVFVFSGNGAQWAGMGRASYASSAAFRAAFAEVDSYFAPLAGWSLINELAGESIESDLAHARIAQPMIFAIQAASVRALAKSGVRPAVTIGHSVGEVAAAEAAGILSLREAVRVVYYRSLYQEVTENRGGMAVVIGDTEVAEELAGQVPNLAIAGYNSHRCIAVAGATDAIDKLSELAAGSKLKVRRLDLAYPYHSQLMEPVKAPLLASLADLKPSIGTSTFVSTVTGCEVSGDKLVGAYWWRNVREPVLFRAGVTQLLAAGKRLFLEIGPRPMLMAHIRDEAERMAAPAILDSVLDPRHSASDPDPFEEVTKRLIARGGAVDAGRAFGDDPGAGVDLPAYPWRRIDYRFSPTSEATGQFLATPRHPLVGARDDKSALEWHSTLDTDLEPALADHKVRGQIMLPGAALLEMALSVARDWAGDRAAVSGFEIMLPLTFVAGASREIRCRVSASTGTLEILSRPRLSAGAFALHARGKILSQAGPPPEAPVVVRASSGVAAEEVYRYAEAVGLEFGPEFRRLARAQRIDDRRIVVELTDEVGDARYGLDPARLDSCFHGLVLLFGTVSGVASAYLPVRFEYARCLAPGAQLSRATIQVRRFDDRSIIADFDLFDAEDELVATLRGARYQATRSQTAGGLSRLGLVRRWAPGGNDLASRGQRKRILDSRPEQSSRGSDLDDAALLMESWATAAAYKFARSLAVDGRVDLDRLFVNGGLAEWMRPWTKRVLNALEESQLIEPDAGAWKIVHENMPDPERFLAVLLAQHPERGPEALLAAAVNDALAKFIPSHAFELKGPSESAIENYEQRSLAARAVRRGLAQRLDEITLKNTANIALRILLVGAGSEVRDVIRFATRSGSYLTIFEPDARRLERARLVQGDGEIVNFVSDLSSLEPRGFDVVASAGGLSRIVDAATKFSELATKLASEAAIVAFETAPSLFADLTLGLAGALRSDSISRQMGAGVWDKMCAQARLVRPKAGRIDFASEHIREFAAEAREYPRGVVDHGQLTLLGLADDAFADRIADSFAAEGVDCVRGLNGAVVDARAANAFVWVVGGLEQEATARVAANCLALRELALAVGHMAAEIAIVAASDDAPTAMAVFSFSRTLANEFPHLVIRRIEVRDRGAASARRIVDVILAKSKETDVSINGSASNVLRFMRPLEVESLDPKRTEDTFRKLEKSRDGGLDRLQWVPAANVSPGEGQIEVEVVATGLNFRDVMWALSILPDEMLEDGFAGPTLGLEFAGRVIKVGPGVLNLEIGDEVVGLCGGSFASRLVVGADNVAHLPAGVSPAAAATIPVAFLTAYYALVTCANLGPDEWVLIHGGAGGVGLAALQIARHLGARVIVTAGTTEKRALTRYLGAEHAFDSRNGEFVDEVLRVTGGLGVNVVLNSLAGEPMERSLGLLAPCGRFVELGKRDYLGDTAIGLRPFRKNLSYFGVDLDQLILARPQAMRKLFIDVLAHFAAGRLTPLPYVEFDHFEISDAMRLMQRSGHIGKIVVRPPPSIPVATTKSTSANFKVDPACTHVISGGLGGFGLAAAEWLVEKGARHLALMGRSGASSEKAQQAVASLRDRGVEVCVGQVDVADPLQVEQFFADIKKTMPAVVGVMHAAMVLDDTVVANMTGERLLRVLRPKIAGAEALDRQTRSMTLDYFVLFSSATTAVGNPGQGAYVAANGFLEGLARSRRDADLPALAIGWGAIADVGVLTRNSATRETLERKIGVAAIPARVALEAFAEAAGRSESLGDDGTIFIVDVNWSQARSHLPLLSAPAYDGVVSGAGAEVAGAQSEVIDLRALSVKMNPHQARNAVTEIVVDEISRILRLPRDEVSSNRTLADIGLDSLMAVELAMSLEARFGSHVSVTGSPGALTVVELAGQLIDTYSSSDEDDPLVQARELAKRHIGASNWEAITPMLTKLNEQGVSLLGATSLQHSN